jgi:tetraacyldisaccharide 4'-kinase
MAAPGGDDRDPSARGLVEGLWAGELGPARWLLGPVLTLPEVAFRGVVALRDLAYSTGLLRSIAPPAPAICVGNLTVGGSGKTPVVRWLVSRLLERDRTPAILHGGYALDEPALHRQWFPALAVVTDRDRVQGATTAVQAGADVLVLDDGFQHRRLARDLDLVLVAAERSGARPRLLPRGPFREPLRALERADVILVTRRTADHEAAAALARRLHGRWDRPTSVVHLAPGRWLAPDGSQRDHGPDEPCIAVAAIARPGAFFRQVAESGAALADVVVFRDHHSYTEQDADRIHGLARGRPLVTTAKDAVKLTALVEGPMWVLDQVVRFESGREALEARLREVAP